MADQSRPHGAAIWSMVDQALSSASNFAIVVIAARLLTPREFGRFTVTYGAFIILMGVTQAVVSEPLVLEAGSHATRQVRSRSAISAALVAGSAGFAVLCVLAWLSPAWRLELICAAICLPFVLVEDASRFACAVLDRMRVAAAIDGLWLALALIAAAALAVFVTHRSAWQLFLAWAGTGALAGVAAGVVVVRYMSREVRSDMAPFRTHHYLGYRFVLEFVAVRGVSQAMVISLGWFVSLSAAGALRGMTTLYGPIYVLVQAVTLFAAPIVRKRTIRQRTTLLIGVGLALGLVGLMCTATFLLLPDRYGHDLLGSTWIYARALIVPLGLQASCVGAFGAELVGIRLTHPRATLWLQLSSSLWFVVLFLVGVSLFGVRGAAWSIGIGTATQAIAGAAIYFHLTRRALSATLEPSRPVSD